MIAGRLAAGSVSAGSLIRLTAMIDLRGLTKVYQTPVGPFPALKGIDLQIAPGEFIAVVGKSGSGKSTLINMFTGIDHPTDGEIIVAGRRVRELSEGQMAEWRGPDDGHRVPVLPAAAHADARRKRHAAHGPGTALHARPNATSGRFTCWTRSGWRMMATSSLRPCRAASSSARRSRVRSPTIRRSSWQMNRPATWTRRPPRRSLRLFETSAAAGKTIVMVTHDDELAERASRTVVLADGLIVDEIVRHASGVGTRSVE